MLDKLLRLAAATLLLSSSTESLLAQVGEGSLELASPFVEGAILQREMPVPIWGWASPGSAIRVSFADQTDSATTDEHGRWRIDLAPLAASHTPLSLIHI